MVIYKSWSQFNSGDDIAPKFCRIIIGNGMLQLVIGVWYVYYLDMAMMPLGHMDEFGTVVS